MQLRMFHGSSRLRDVHLHCGDWRDQAASWPESYVLLTDPPYGFGWTASGSRGAGSRKLARTIANDHDTSERDAVLERGFVVAAVFGPSPKKLLATPPWGDPKEILVWDKGDGVGMGDLAFPWRPNLETIAIYGRGWRGKRTSSVLRGRVVAFSTETARNAGRTHPHEKPLEVIAELIAKAPPDLPVVDPFMGTGVVAEAAVLLGRTFYGSELEAPYYEEAKRRACRAVAGS